MAGVMEGGREGKENWLVLMRHIKARGLADLKFILSAKCLELMESLV